MKQFDAWGKIDGLLRDLQLGFADADLEKRFWARQWTQARALGIFTATVGVLIVSAHGVTGVLKYLDIVDIPFAPDFLNLPPGREPFLLAVVFAQALAIAVGILNFFYAPRWMTEQHQWWWWAFTFLLLDCAQQFPGQGLDIHTMGAFNFNIVIAVYATRFPFHQALFVALVASISTLAHGGAQPRGPAQVNACGALSHALVGSVTALLTAVVAFRAERAARHQFMGEERRHAEEAGLRAMATCLLPEKHVDWWLARERDAWLVDGPQASSHGAASVLTIIFRASSGGDVAEEASSGIPSDSRGGGAALLSQLRSLVSLLDRKLASRPGLRKNAAFGNCYQAWGAHPGAATELATLAVEVSEALSERPPLPLQASLGAMSPGAFLCSGDGQALG
ncbi:hypothetical protein T484DRAFT_1905237, partial [Baffinella frigidus]